MASSPMHRLLSAGRFRLYYANRRWFLMPGLWVWTGTTNVRVLPLPRRRDER